jgi:hypothetical protein
MKRILIIVAVLFLSQAYSQNIFDEKFDGCNTDYFKTESDTTTVELVSDFVKILSSNFDDETVKKIRGLLSLQIIVDADGKSCLLSLENETNISTANLAIKSIIDSKLLWEKPKEKISVILATKFYGNAVEVKRIGLSKEKGFHELAN